MAEFCKDCFNKLNGTDTLPKGYKVSKYRDLCEECGEIKPVVLSKWVWEYRYIKPRLPFPFKQIYVVLYVIWRLIRMPYTLYEFHMLEKKERENK